MTVIAASITIFTILLFFIREARNTKLMKTVTQIHRGTSSERKLIVMLLKAGFAAENLYHDLYLKKSNGYFTQIDLVLITEVGLIIFEIKDYSGWLFGSGNRINWTQVLAYGEKKFRFYNPIFQNKKHIEDLQRQIGIKYRVPCFSVIVFFGDCEFKNIDSIPSDTYLIKPYEVNSILKRIINENKPIQIHCQKQIIELMRNAVETGESKEIQLQHIKNVNNTINRYRLFS